jgi:asparagine synthase (glutamine-hydrolysing)
MCGICGVLSQQSNKVDVVGKMLKAIKHRGPDGEGFYHSRDISLGVCLLSIVDSEKGQQPIFNEDKSACIVFNGEIYNHRFLRENLMKKGHHFLTNSDAEVVLHLYEEYKEACVDYLEGMFAFAIWDGQMLFLARDRMGIKPLFYAYSPETQEFVFASEIKAMFQHPHIKREINRKALCELQVLGFILLPDLTLEKHVKQLCPGSTLKVALNGDSINLDKGVYFLLRSSSARDVYEECDDLEESMIEKLEFILRESCRAIVKHDELPKAIYLSGGLDSSLLAVFCAEESPSPIHTFTIADSKESEDLKYARKVAQAIGSIHHEILVSEEECIEDYPKFLEAYENIPAEGTFDLGGDFAFFLASKYISKYVKVAICGEGADELFGGYWMHRWPLGYADRIFKRLSEFDSETASELALKLQEWFPPEEDREVYRRGVFDLLLGSGLSNYHLWAVDRASMWHGLEVRVPYLHDKVVKFVMNLPLNLKVRDDNTKYILRKVAKKVFDQYSLDEILSRPKWAMPDALKKTSTKLQSVNLNKTLQKI